MEGEVVEPLLGPEISTQIERAFREVRRRTRPMNCFQNAASVDRIIYGVISHLNNSWGAKPLRKFTHNT